MAGTVEGDVLGALGISASEVLRPVHNHPINVYCAGLTATSPLCVPNNSPSKKDWVMYNQFVSNGIEWGQAIVGPDGTERFFNGSNQNYPGGPGTVPPGAETPNQSCP
jgi:hypothetical protein